jgi:peptidoglycan hydrolase CwlO-like protein
VIRMAKGRLFIVITVVIGILAVFYGSRAAKPVAGQPALEERNEALERLTGLNEQERALVAELLDWDVRLEAARQDYELLTREIPLAEKAVKDAEAGLQVTRQQLREGQDKLGRWVNFLYRYGPVAYLEVILGATSFNDFVARAESVKIIIVSQVRLLSEVRDLQHRQEEQAQIQRRAQEELMAKTAALSQKIAEMDRERAGREAFLAELREQSSVLAGRVIESETVLLQSINPLRYLLSHLDALPWDDLSPEKISFERGGLRMEFADREVNRVFFERGDPNLASLSIKSSSGLFSISGRTEDAVTDFKVEGNFVLEGEGKVRFQPSRVLLAGLPVSGKVLEYISSDHQLSFDLGERTRGLRLTDIHAEEGKLIVELAAS